jgi:hypothetical protein
MFEQMERNKDATGALPSSLRSLRASYAGNSSRPTMNLQKLCCTPSGVSISRDGGETFAISVFSKELNDAHCQGAIARGRWKKGGKPGVLAFSNQAWPWRNYLMVRFSYDDGKTWPAARVIYPWTSAYSSVATLPDGSIGVLFEKDFWGSISFATVPVPNQPLR